MQEEDNRKNLLIYLSSNTHQRMLKNGDRLEDTIFWMFSMLPSGELFSSSVYVVGVLVKGSFAEVCSCVLL